MRPLNARKIEKTQPLPQAGKVCFRSNENQIPRGDTQRRDHTNGSSEG